MRGEYAEFRISTIPSDDGTARIVLEGELDLYTAPELKNAIVDLGDGLRWLTVDLSGVEFIDSAGLGILVAAARTMRGRGGSISLVGVDHGVHKVFRVTGLDSWFELTRDGQPS
jgi:anti-sigma B factor antagonist